MAKIAEYEKCCSCSSNGNSVSTNTNNNVATEEKTIHIEKRVLSERDVIDACTGGILTVYYTKRTIVTDLAKDYAKSHRMHLICE